MVRNINRFIDTQRRAWYSYISIFLFVQQFIYSNHSVARLNREWKVEYMKTFLHDSDVRWEGIEIGKEIGKEIQRIELICCKLRKGKSPEIISDELEEELDDIQFICDIASEFAPEYDSQNVYQVYSERKSK